MSNRVSTTTDTRSPHASPGTGLWQAQLINVGKAYRLGNETRWVVRNVDLQVGRGEIVFLVGPSGSGKSTLLSILGLLLTPDEGGIELLGEKLAGMSSETLTSLRRRSIGFVFQKFQLIRGLTATENVALPLTLKGVSRRLAFEQAVQFLNRIGLYDYRNALTTRMSPGQCQRIAIARALIARPDLVLADEPTASLDSDSGQRSMELLSQLAKEAGASVVVVTHDSRIFGYADRVHRVNNGRLGPASRPELDDAVSSPSRPIAAALLPTWSTPVIEGECS